MHDDRTLTIAVPATIFERLRALAMESRRSEEDVAADAVAAYVDDWAWRDAAIREALAADEAGEPAIAHADVAAWVTSWGSVDELPLPG